MNWFMAMHGWQIWAFALQNLTPFTTREFVLLGFVVVLIALLVFASHRVQELSQKLRRQQRTQYKQSMQHRKDNQP